MGGAIAVRAAASGVIPSLVGIAVIDVVEGKNNIQQGIPTSAHATYIASSPGHSQILFRSRGENREKAWDQNYVTDQKWWTLLVCNMDSVCTNRVHHFQSVT